MALGVGLALLVAFLAVSARARRERGRPARRLPARPGIGSGPRLSVPLPPRWLAVQTRDQQQVRKALGLQQAMPCSWAEGLCLAREHKLFIAPPLGRWVLVMGLALPDPAEDVDRCFHFLVRLSRRLGRVQFFALNRPRGHHAWVSVNHGAVERAYVWAGQTVWNQGHMTRAEQELGLRCLDYGAEPEMVAGSRGHPLACNLERLPALAARWSVNPAAVDARGLCASGGVVGALSKPKPH